MARLTSVLALPVFFLLGLCLHGSKGTDHRPHKMQSLQPAPTKYPQKWQKFANLQALACRSDLERRDIEILWRDSSPYAFPSSENANSTGPPSGIIPSIVQMILSTCCHDLEELKVTYKQQSLEDTDIEADVVYGAAVAGMPMNPPAQSSLEGRYVTVVQSPGAAYVVRDDYLAPNLVQSLTDTQYLLYFVLASAGVAGILMWLAEHHGNSEDFPEAFPHGFLDGIWWSIITMTTVGYGDKVPRSFLGRLLALVWVLCGVVMVTLFTASVTTSLTTASLAYNVHIQGSKVAVVKGGPEYKIAILNGANVTLRTDTVQDALQAVARGAVDGAVIDQLACGDALSDAGNPLTNPNTGLQIAQVLIQNTNYGIFFTPNRSNDRIEECANLVVRNMERDIYLSVQELSSSVEERRVKNEMSLAQSAQKLFASSWQDSIITSYGVFGSLLFIGFLYHFLYWAPRHKDWSWLGKARHPLYTKLNDTDGPASRSNEQFQALANPPFPNSTSPLQNILENHMRELEELEQKRTVWLVDWEKQRRAILERQRREQEEAQLQSAVPNDV